MRAMPRRPLPPHVEHGSTNAYNRHHCRCPECRAAKAAANERAALERVRRQCGRPTKGNCECGKALTDGRCVSCDELDRRYRALCEEWAASRERVDTYDADGWWKKPQQPQKKQRVA